MRNHESTTTLGSSRSTTPRPACWCARAQPATRRRWARRRFCAGPTRRLREALISRLTDGSRATPRTRPCPTSRSPRRGGSRRWSGTSRPTSRWRRSPLPTASPVGRLARPAGLAIRRPCVRRHRRQRSRSNWRTGEFTETDAIAPGFPAGFGRTSSPTARSSYATSAVPSELTTSYFELAPGEAELSPGCRYVAASPEVYDPGLGMNVPIDPPRIAARRSRRRSFPSTVHRSRLLARTGAADLRARSGHGAPVVHGH